mgnify:CR=1 FL=1
MYTRRPRKNRQPLTAQDARDIKTDYRTNKLNTKEIAAKYHIGHRRVVNILAGNESQEIETDNYHPPPRHPPSPPPLLPEEETNSNDGDDINAQLDKLMTDVRDKLSGLEDRRQ